MTEAADKARALRKWEAEVEQDIQRVVALSARATFLELAYLLFLLRVARVQGKYPETTGLGERVVRVAMNLTEETLRYLIQCVVKFGQAGGLRVPREGKGMVLDRALVGDLLQIGNLLNAKHQQRSLLQLFDVEVRGERDRYVGIDMSRVHTDARVRRLYEYLYRLERSTEIRKQNFMSAEELITDFERRFEAYADLFHAELGVPLELYTWLFRHLLAEFQDRVGSVERQCLRPDGMVDVGSEEFFVRYTLATRFQTADLVQRFGAEVEVLIDRLSFNPGDFDERELRFNRITRQPLVQLYRGEFMLSPELLLDSLSINIHYTLQNAHKEIKEAYQARSADAFLSEIAAACREHGYFEVSRNLPLKEGKRDLGDIDLVLRNEGGEHLLIEAKNHVVPLPVYFGDIASIGSHLDRLQDKWERKLEIRLRHLEERSGEYGIPATDDFRYLVVSRFPEVISHFSRHAFISLSELPSWLHDQPTFDELRRRLYDADAVLDQEDWILLRQQGHSLRIDEPPTDEERSDGAAT